MFPRKNNDTSELGVNNIKEEEHACKKIKLEKDIENEESEEDSCIDADYDIESDESESRKSLYSDISRIVNRIDPEPEYDDDSVLLSWYDSDLNLVINEKTFSAACPLHWRGFCFLQAGIRATHGFRSGRVCFEVKITALCKLKYLKGHLNTHLIRIGWSPMNSSLALGSDFKSFGYDSNGRASTKGEIKDYGMPFNIGDVVGAYLDLNETSAVLTFSVNGVDQGIAYEIEHSKTNGEPMFPHILTKNMAFECNFGQEKPWFAPKKGFTFVDDMPLEQRIPGPRRPKSKAECEVIMLIGLPKSGKSKWAQTISAQHPGKYYIIDIANLVDKMELADPKRKAMVFRKANVLGKLLKISRTRRRNYILDQVNATHSGQQWKMKLYKKYQRRAVVFVIPDAELQKRLLKDHEEDAGAINFMKAKFSLPQPTFLLKRIEYAELPQSEAKKLVNQYKQDALLKTLSLRNTMDPYFIFHQRGKMKSFKQKSYLLRRRRFADSVGEPTRAGSASPQINQDWHTSHEELPQVGRNSPQRGEFGGRPSKNRNYFKPMRGRNPGSWENNQMRRRSWTPQSEEFEFPDPEYYSAGVDNWPTTAGPHGRASSFSPPRNKTGKRMFSPELRARRNFHEEQFADMDKLSYADSCLPSVYKFREVTSGNRKRKRSCSPQRDAVYSFTGLRKHESSDFLHHQGGLQTLPNDRVELDLIPPKRSSSFSPHQEFFAQQPQNEVERCARSGCDSFQSNSDFPPRAYCDGSEVRVDSRLPPDKEMGNLSPHRKRFCSGSYAIKEKIACDFSPGKYCGDRGFPSERVRRESPFPIQLERNSVQKRACEGNYHPSKNERRNFRFHEAKMSDFHQNEMEVSDGPVRDEKHKMIAVRDRFYSPGRHSLPSRGSVHSMSPRKSRGNIPSRDIEASRLPSCRSDLSQPSVSREVRQSCNWLPSEVDLLPGDNLTRNENGQWNSGFPISRQTEGESYHNRREGSCNQSIPSSWQSDPYNEFPSVSQHRSRSPDSTDISHHIRGSNIGLAPSGMPQGISPMSQNYSWGGIDPVSVGEDFGGRLMDGPGRSLHHGSRSPAQVMRMSPVQNMGKSPTQSPQRHSHGNWSEYEENVKGMPELFSKDSTGHISRSHVRSVRRFSGRDRRTSPGHNSRTPSSRRLRKSPGRCDRKSPSRDHRVSPFRDHKRPPGYGSESFVNYHLRRSPACSPRLSSAEGSRSSPLNRRPHICGLRRSDRPTRWSSPVREPLGTPGEREDSPLGEDPNWNQNRSFEREPNGLPIQHKRGSLNRGLRRSPKWNSRRSSNMEQMQSSRAYEVEVSKGSSVNQERSQMRYCSPHNYFDDRHPPRNQWQTERRQMGNWPSGQPEDKVGPSAEGMYHCGKQGGIASENKPSLNAEDRRPQCLRERLGPKVSDEGPAVPIDTTCRMDIPERVRNSQPLHDFHRSRRSPYCSDSSDGRWERRVVIVPESQSNPDYEELAPYEQPFDQALWDSNGHQSALKHNDRGSRKNVDVEPPESCAISHIRPPDSENRGNIWARVGGYVDDERKLGKGLLNRQKEAVSFHERPTLPRDLVSPRRRSREHQAKTSSRIGRSPDRRGSPRKSHFPSERFLSYPKDKDCVRGHWKSPPRRRNARW